ncbi:2-Hydroxyacid oxidase 1-like [Anopheles bellator]|uniref:2-Hydroxyacid oxidase 1-like n=1 Tax=Anopheles bellator TaxID=139047 RepID=UPI002649FE4F|nr:2-Hydroxyacid oxidase 1-like [Anopheles bellator]
METLADPDPNVKRWLELFPFVDENILRILVQRAEKCRYRAIVLTVAGPEKRNRSKEKDFVRQPDFEMLLREGHPMHGKPILVEPQLASSVVTVLKRLTELPIVAAVQMHHETMVADLLQNDVDAVILTIGPYTPFCSYIEALQKAQQNAANPGLIFAGGSCFTEDEVAQLVANGVERVFIDLPALWGLVIDGADGVSNVIEIYKKELSK